MAKIAADESRRFSIREPSNATKFCSNQIRTYKYSVYPVSLDFFVWKNIYEQLLRIANLYFLVISLLQLIPDLSPTGRFTTLLTLACVMTFSAAKAVYEDYHRHQSDRKTNSRTAQVLGDTGFEDMEWQKVSVGDIIKVTKRDDFPADIIMLYSSGEAGQAYVETSNLDGETNLKHRSCLMQTQEPIERALEAGNLILSGTVESEVPNRNLYSFTGTLKLKVGKNDLSEISLSTDQVLLRGSQLRKVDCIIGIVVFTGQESKVMMNSSNPPHKRSKLERAVNTQLRWVFGFQILLCLFCCFGLGSWTITDAGEDKTWYLWREGPIWEILFKGFFTFIILYNNIIPISLYVSIEMVKFLQGSLINSDLRMYHSQKNMPSSARCTSLNEELGQVEYIFTDKTGTLTRNEMRFLKFSVSGISYGEGVTEIGHAAAKRQGKFIVDERPLEIQKSTKNQFWDKRVSGGKWMQEPTANEIRRFFTALAVCHTVIPEVDQVGNLKMQAESPDEAALVDGAAHFGFIFRSRQNNCLLIEINGIQECYTVLNILPFNSTRKRMSVIFRNPKGEIVLYCKGADSVVMERLDHGTPYKEQTQAFLDQFAAEGLRILVVAQRILDEETYREWDADFQQATKIVGDDRHLRVAEMAEAIENQLNLIGVSAIEDKLQDRVPQTIETLRLAGIAIWMLTGDKQETAINIGFACSLIHGGTELITFNQEDKQGLMDAFEAAKARIECLPTGTEIATVMTGGSMTVCFNDDAFKESLWYVVSHCKSVICCRVSPIQKAEVVNLVRKRQPAAATVAIGDGANDVSMIQASHVGVGISGMEGQQASNASDYCIGQFRFLERLIMLHGRWNYIRIAMVIIYSFYKNFVMQMTQFFFCLFTGFSGTSFYDTWVLVPYNVIFTSCSIIVFGVLDRDLLHPERLRQFPDLYEHTRTGKEFNTVVFIQWISVSIFHAFVCFIIPWLALGECRMRNGQIYGRLGHGLATYTCVVITVHLKLALEIQSWTIVHHATVWVSILAWPTFLVIYDPLTWISWPMHGVVWQVTGEASFWLTIAITCVVAIGRDVVWKYYWAQIVPINHMSTVKQVQRMDALKTIPVPPSEPLDEVEESNIYKGSREPDVVTMGRGWTLRFRDFPIEMQFLDQFFGNLGRYKITFSVFTGGVLIVRIPYGIITGGDKISTTVLWFVNGAMCLALCIMFWGLRKVVKRYMSQFVILFVFLTTYNMSIAHFISADGSSNPAARHPSLVLLTMGFICCFVRPSFFAMVQCGIAAVILYSVLNNSFRVSAWTVYEVFVRIIELVGSIYALLFLGMAMERYERQGFIYKKLREKWDIRSDIESERTLLLMPNVMPAIISSKIKEGVPMCAMSMRYERASVLKATANYLREIASPSLEVVIVLSKLITTLDEVISQHGAIRIRTMGDCFIAATGILVEDPHHHTRIADTGLALISAVHAFNQQRCVDVNLKIGIASGPVVVGFAGYAKLRYEVFGETLKEAEAMERTCTRMSVQCTEAQYKEFKTLYMTEVTTQCSVSGQPKPQYFLTGKKNNINYPVLKKDVIYRQVAKDDLEFRRLVRPATTQVRNGLLWRAGLGELQRSLQMQHNYLNVEWDEYVLELAKEEFPKVAILGFILTLCQTAIMGLFWIAGDRSEAAKYYLGIFGLLAITNLVAYVVAKRQRNIKHAASEIPEPTKGETRITKAIRIMTWNYDYRRVFATVMSCTLNLVNLSMLVGLWSEQTVAMIPFFAIMNLIFFSSFNYWTWSTKAMSVFTVWAAYFALTMVQVQSGGESFTGNNDLISLLALIILLVLGLYQSEKAQKLMWGESKSMLLTIAETKSRLQANDNLLRAVLPAGQLFKLQNDPEQKFYDDMPNATVMLVHVIGAHDWTEFTQPIDPYKTMHQFNDLLYKMDSRIPGRKVEKIRSIPYTLVAGCPEASDSHCQDMVNLACQFLEIAQEWNEDDERPKIQLRMGIASGSVFGAVMGTQTWAYDIFGPVVDGAGTLMAAAQPGSILVSCETKQGMSSLTTQRHSFGPETNYNGIWASECTLVDKKSVFHLPVPIKSHDVAVMDAPDPASGAPITLWTQANGKEGKLSTKDVIYNQEMMQMQTMTEEMVSQDPARMDMGSGLANGNAIDVETNCEDDSEKELLAECQ